MMECPRPGRVYYAQHPRGQLQDGGRVLTPAIANDPGGVIGQIERFDFLDEDGDCLAKALFVKGRLFAQLTFSGIR